VAAENVSILSWNIRWGGKDRLEAILQRIAATAPDIAVLSEVTGDEAGQALKAGLMAQGFTAFTDLPPPGRHLGVLVASKAPLLAVEVLMAPGLNPWHVVAVEFADCRVVGVYLPWDDRKAPYWALLHEYLLKEHDKPVLVTGDFNTGLSKLDGSGEALKHATAMAKLSEFGLYDPWRAAYSETIEYTWGQGDSGTQRLDYAFVPHKLGLADIAVRYSHQERLDGVSDHSMLLIDVKTAALVVARQAKAEAASSPSEQVPA